MLVNAWPVRDGDGTILAGVATHVDVTSRIEADSARDAFLGVLSHELRTPITSIYAGAELLQRRVDRRRGHPRAGGRRRRRGEPAPPAGREPAGPVARRARRRPPPRRPGAAPPPRAARRRVRGGALAGRRGSSSRCPQHAACRHRRRLVRRADPAQPALERGQVRPAGRPDPPGARADRRRGHDPGAGRGARVRARAPRTGCSTCSTGRRRRRGRAPGAGIGLYAVRALASAMNGRVWARNRPEGGAEVGGRAPGDRGGVGRGHPSATRRSAGRRDHGPETEPCRDDTRHIGPAGRQFAGRDHPPGSPRRRCRECHRMDGSAERPSVNRSARPATTAPRGLAGAPATGSRGSTSRRGSSRPARARRPRRAGPRAARGARPRRARAGRPPRARDARGEVQVHQLGREPGRRPELGELAPAARRGGRSPPRARGARRRPGPR